MIFKTWLLLSILNWTLAIKANPTLTSFVCDDEILKTTALKLGHLETAVENLRLQINILNLIINKEFNELKEAIASIGSRMPMPSSSEILQDYAGLIDVRNAKATTNSTITSAGTSSISSNQPLTNVTNIPTTISSEATFSNANQPQSGVVSFIPSNCDEAIKLSGRPNELHKIRIPDSKLQPFFVYCLEDPNGDGGAWTIIQRRIDGKIDFFRKWNDYKIGFGNLETEFFIGLDKLHALTNFVKHELWIEMEDFKTNKRYAKYSSFAIGDESEAYALNILGNYTGDAGDSLTWHAGQKFTTKDVDNDNHDTLNCAVQFTGAWWYHECYRSNLNGQYIHGTHSNFKFNKGIIWHPWHDDYYYYSLKYVHMAIRPLKVEL